jgi:hypothetical protein
VTADNFDAYFEHFTRTAVRLETLPAYDVGGAEAERIHAWRQGLPRPVNSVRTAPWLARVAVTTATAGKSWKRVRVVDDPLTWYQRQQVTLSYVEAQAAGDEVVIARRADVPDHGPDVWAFDLGTSSAAALVMQYDGDGHWLGYEAVTDAERLGEIAARIHRVEDRAVPLNVFLTAAASA